MILYVSCHTLKEIRFKYTDRDLKYTKLKSHLQSASVILLYWTYVYLRLLWFLSTYGFLTVQKHSQCYEDLTPVLAHILFSHPAFKLCVCEAPGLRPPLLTAFCSQISEDSRFHPRGLRHPPTPQAKFSSILSLEEQQLAAWGEQTLAKGLRPWSHKHLW